jgi:hypothetical protein
MSLTFIHSRLAITSILYVGILSVWGFITFFRKQTADSNYWGALAIGEVLLFVQAVIGGILYFGGLGEPPERTIHILYGVLSPMVIPAIFLFTKGDENRRVILIYAAGLLFLVGIVIRATTTG